MLMFRLLLTLAMAMFAATAIADGGYLLGGDLQVDDADGIGVTGFGQLSVGEDTSISGALGRSTVDVASDLPDSDSVYADLGIDHRFGLFGMRFTAAYWGDSDLLDSTDLRGSVYLRGEHGSIGFDYEDRDLEFQLPPLDFLNRTSFPFTAAGRGLSARLNVSDTVTVYASGMEYDYSVPLQVQESDRIRRLILISRLSVLSSLVDWRVSGGIDIEVGEKVLGLDLSRWEGAVTGSSNDSVTLRFLTPVSKRVDMELSLGIDESEIFGDASIAGIRFYYYGGQ